MRPDQLNLGAAICEPWVSVEQITEHLGVTRDSIYRWIDRKSLSAQRTGCLWKFKISEVGEWALAGGTVDESDGKNR